MDKPLALGPNIGRKATCSQYNSIAYLMLQCSRCFKSYRGLTNFYTNVISLLNSATVLEFNLCEAREKFWKSSLLDNLEHSGLDENEGDGERVSAAAVDQALERLLRIELAEVVGQAGGCRLADHLKQGGPQDLHRQSVGSWGLFYSPQTKVTLVPRRTKKKVHFHKEDFSPLKKVKISGSH